MYFTVPDIKTVKDKDGKSYTVRIVFFIFMDILGPFYYIGNVDILKVVDQLSTTNTD